MINTNSITKSVINFASDLFKGVAGFDLSQFPIPPIEFSDDEPPTEEMGSLTAEEIQEKIRKLLERKYEEGEEAEGQRENQEENAEENAEPSQRELDYERYGRIIEPALYCPNRLYDGEYPAELQPVISKILSYWKQLKHTVTVGGLYFSNTRSIKIFNKVFAHYPDPTEQDAAIRQTIAHEMFHAIHHYYADTTYVQQTRKRKVVIETLADMVAYCFCLDQGAAALDGIAYTASQQSAWKRYEYWEKNFLISDLPYPKARFFMYRGGRFEQDKTLQECYANGAVDKMCKVLELSRADMVVAYEELIPPEFREQIRVLKVKLGNTNRSYSYLFDPNDNGAINVGDAVLCETRNGHIAEGVVCDAQEMTEAEYQAECDRIGYSALAIARRKL